MLTGFLLLKHVLSMILLHAFGNPDDLSAEQEHPLFGDGILPDTTAGQAGAIGSAETNILESDASTDKGVRRVENPDEHRHNQPRRFYRIISGREPTRNDFLSDEVRGKVRPGNPARIQYWQGFSVFETLAQACGIIEVNKVRADEKGLTWEEKFIVEVTIPPDSSITDERWGRNEGHYTIWGDADECLACVTGTFPATPHEGE